MVSFKKRASSVAITAMVGACLLSSFAYAAEEEAAANNGTVKVSVQFDDNNNQDKIRPNTITVQLFTEGKAFGDEQTLSASNGWQYTWTDLDASKEYTVNQTVTPYGYTKAVSNNGNEYTIINKHDASAGSVQQNPAAADNEKTDGNAGSEKETGTEPEQTESTKSDGSQTGSISWDDENDKNGKRPAAINVQLYKDGTAEGNPVQLNKANEWKYTWSKLDSGSSYSIDIPNVPYGYTKEVNGMSVKLKYNSSTSAPAATQSDSNKTDATQDKDTKATENKPASSTSQTSQPAQATQTAKNDQAKPASYETTSSTYKNPQTADLNSIGTWIGTAIASGAGMIGTAGFIKPRKKH